jgi:hypothetical protein
MSSPRTVPIVVLRRREDVGGAPVCTAEGGLGGGCDANEDVVGKGRRHCQRSSSSRERPMFVGAAGIYDGTGLGCSSDYGEGGHQEPCQYPRPPALRRRARDEARRRARIPRQEEAAGPRAGAYTAPTSSESSFGSSRHGDGPRG